MMCLGSVARGKEPSRGKWPYEVTSGMFRLHADFEIDATAEFVTELNQVVSDVERLLSTKPTTPMHIVLFDRPEEYKRYLSHYFPKLPERRALFIRQRGTAMLFAHRHPELATDLRHESVHAIINDSEQSFAVVAGRGAGRIL